MDCHETVVFNNNAGSGSGVGRFFRRRGSSCRHGPELLRVRLSPRRRQSRRFRSAFPFAGYDSGGRHFPDQLRLETSCPAAHAVLHAFSSGFFIVRRVIFLAFKPREMFLPHMRVPVFRLPDESGSLRTVLNRTGLQERTALQEPAGPENPPERRAATKQGMSDDTETLA